MIESIEFSKLKYFSKLFIDFINGSNDILDFFDNNSFEIKFEKRLKETENKRTFIIEAIYNSITKINLSDKQKSNLESLKLSNTLLVITGQQPAIFGGPLYTIYKSLTAIFLCNKLNEEFQNYNFVPIFWIEDNDSDTDEINNAIILDNEYNLIKNYIEIPKKKIYSQIKISKKEVNKIFDYQILNSIDDDNLLSDLFQQYINYYLKDYGLLYIKSSELLKSNYYKDFIKREFSEPGKSKFLIDSNNNELLRRNYHIQAIAYDINFFFTKNGYRHRIEFKDNKFSIDDNKYEKNEIIDLIENHYYNFTPKVLFRPLFQDYFLPTAAYIGGPSEIAYLAQLKNLYKDYNITMPIIYPRHSITILNNFAIRNLSKINKTTEYFFRKNELIEQEFSIGLIESDLEELFEIEINNIKKIYDELFLKIKDIDKALEVNKNVAIAKSLDILSDFRKKTISALKKKHQVELNRIKKLHNFLFPMNLLQERVLNFHFFLSRYDIDFLKLKFNEIFTNDSNKHYLVEFNDLSN